MIAVFDRETVTNRAYTTCCAVCVVVVPLTSQQRHIHGLSSDAVYQLRQFSEDS